MEKPTRIIASPGVRALSWGSRGYLRLGDIARLAGRRVWVADWLRNQSTLEHLAAWERIHNPAFNYGQLAIVRDNTKKDGGRRISVCEWTQATNAIGLRALEGRHGGTYAVVDIAMHFARWVKPTPFYPIQIGAVFHSRIRDTQYAIRILEEYLAQPNEPDTPAPRNSRQ